MTHIHYWRLATPNGPYVEGRCKTCPAVRYFKTAGEDREIWKDGRSHTVIFQEGVELTKARKAWVLK